MSTLVLRHNPATAMLSNWFDRMFYEPSAKIGHETTVGLQPEMDIADENDRYFVSVDIPGLTKDDVNIKVENGVIKIEGERKEERKGKYFHAERAFGRFMRVLSLPDDVDAVLIEAQVANGVLEIQLPKNRKIQPVEIKIS